MKKVLQNFGSNLLVLFVILNIISNLEVNLAGFRNVWRNTPCPVCHPAMACLPHWCCWKVLPDGVIQHNFYTNGVIYMLVCMGVRRIFSRGAQLHFSKSFYRGGQSGEIWFYHSKLENSLFCWNFQILAPLRNPCLCVEKSSRHTIKKLV